MEIKNKVFVVTGGGSGLGRALVLELLAKGAKVAAADINESGLQETVNLSAEHKSNLSTHILDITNKEAVSAFPEQVIAKHGSIDGLINNAGIIQPFIKINDLDYEEIEKVMHVNFYGTLYMTKAFLPHLLKREQAHIANISSMGGFLPVPGQTIYGASKAAVKLFTEGLYAELLETNVGVTIVLPGAMNTNIAKNSGVEINLKNTDSSAMKSLMPDQAAEIVIHAIENKSYRVLVGQDAKFMDFIYRWNPKYAVNFISKKMQSLLPKK